MKSIPLPAEFILEQPRLTWSEIKWGFDRGWLGDAVIVDLAIVRLSENENESPALIELASLGSRQLGEVACILDKLAQAEQRLVADDLDSKRIWLRTILAWFFARRNEIADPLGAVEELYAAFDYPSEISGFVRYMPPDDSYDPQAHAHEENIARLYSKWRDFLDA